MNDKVYNVRFKWQPAIVSRDSQVQRFQVEHSVYSEEYEASITIKAPDFIQAEERALEVARARFPQSMVRPGTSYPWTHAATRRVIDEQR